MRQFESITGPIGRRVIVLTLLASLAALIFFYPRESSSAMVVAQRQRRKQTQRRRPASGASATSKYAHFKHLSHRLPKAKLNCSGCHTIPSAAPYENADPAAQPSDVAAASNPKIKGYPYHDSCVRCHRTEFFKGAAPPICTVCHTRSNPRLTAREIYPFPKLSTKDWEPEFPGYFPHDKHQRVIARTRKPLDGDGPGWSLVRASFSRQAQTQTAEPENCATCHLTDKRQPVAIEVGSSDKFTPPEGTFKTVPSGHADCFNCHWDSQKPTRDECDGCHLTPDALAKEKRASSSKAPLPGLNSPKAALWFKDWPGKWPLRLSLKFNHESKNHNTFGCTTCHINIDKMKTLDIPKADVPITTCVQCHLKDAVEVKTSLSREMSARKKDSKFICTSCHTSIIGREPPKCSHYLVLGQPCK